MKRPPLERTAPDRSFGAGFGIGSLAAGDLGFSEVARTSIETAYRVVDAQLEYGRQFAQQIGFTTRGATNGDFSPSRAPSLEPLLQAYAKGLAEVTSVWLRVMLDFLAQAPAPPPETASEDSGGSAEPDEFVEPRRLFLELRLQPGERGSIETPPLNEVAPHELRVGSLTCRDDQAEFLLVQITTTSDRDTARFGVSVPSGQHPGVYDAVISEPRGRLLGALTVVVTTG